jgi:coenzyme PQQ synthesis protein D (PqqD)
VSALDRAQATGRPARAAERRPVRCEGSRLEAIEGELLLFDPAQATVLYCNQMASVVWHLCDGSRTIAEIARLLGDAFPEARRQVAADVPEAVEQLVAHRALTLTA